MTDQQGDEAIRRAQARKTIAFLIPFTVLTLGHADALLAVQYGLLDGRERLAWGVTLLLWAAVGLIMRSVSASVGRSRKGRLFMVVCLFAFISGIMPVFDPDAMFAFIEILIAVAVITSVCVELTYGLNDDLPSVGYMSAIAQAAGMCGVVLAANAMVSLLLSFAAFIAIIILSFLTMSGSSERS